ncbi:MAG TPA: hypothetical protein VK993_09590 [Chthoniobacterales bacterium]|nr:hypothetical protein [Chthoniobacterales bacterium]
MFPRSLASIVCAVVFCTTSVFAQQAAPPADLYTQIPVLGESGEEKLEGGDFAGAVEDFRMAFEGSRTLSQQYPDEAAYRENAYYYLGRLASAFARANDIPSALQMAVPSARGYSELATAGATPETKEKAADALNRLAWIQVLSKDGTAAEGSARQALTFSPDAALIQMNLAHALLLNGKGDEARTIYSAIKSADAGDGRTLREIILDDFDAMQKAGIRDESMAALRTELGGAPNASARRGKQSALPIWAFMALIVLGIAAIFAAFIYFDRKRTAALESRARTLGFTFRRKATPKDKQLAAGSGLTSVGHSRQIRNVIEMPESDGARMTLFDFSYVIGSGKRNRNYQQTVTRVQSPQLNLPSFDLRPESVLFKIAASLGMKDIDIEGWPNFSRMYLLRGEDDAAIRRIFTPELLRYCEANRGLWISGAGDLLWFHRENRRVRPDELDRFVNAARQTFALFTSGAAARPAAPPPLPPPPLPTA